MRRAVDMVEGLSPSYVLADKAYDADTLIDAIEDAKATACIPPKNNRKDPRDYDRALYKERNQVERMSASI